MRLGIGLVFMLFAFTSFAGECIAHRGNNQLYLENSMEALISALEVGSDGIEFDIHHSKEGEPILMHDKTLARTATHKPGKACPLSRKIADLPLRVIQENCQLQNGEDIPTLEDVLIYFQEFPLYFFIELKDKPSFRTLNLIEDYLGHLPEKIRMISFKNRNLKKFKKVRKWNPFWKKVKLFKVYPAFPFVFGRHGADVYWPFRGFLFWARWLKKETGVWTIDSEKKLKKAHKRKIDFITTNNPQLCLALKNR